MSSRCGSMRGGACNIAPKGYTGAWHWEGEEKCKGNPPRNNNNGRSTSMNFQVKAFSPNGGRRTRKGGAKRRNTRRRRVGGTASSSASNASAAATGTFANGRSGPIGANGRLPTGPGAFDKF